MNIIYTALQLHSFIQSFIHQLWGWCSRKKRKLRYSGSSQHIPPGVWGVSEWAPCSNTWAGWSPGVTEPRKGSGALKPCSMQSNYGLQPPVLCHRERGLWRLQSFIKTYSVFFPLLLQPSKAHHFLPLLVQSSSRKKLVQQELSPPTFHISM